ncbi:MAG: hypothetical protein U1C74_10650 [Phenylobacterium sp.]|jgi:hypothetical protein|uniref:Uncharacterized protein n=1 Tax=Brevundimonas mediterranea TaxID=74329 RepID=A0AB37E663_9CAUL|nr:MULTISPECIES: hypothetical protein [Brevundimonas]MDZ4052870.1 hypothetical protein [Phenylobacterium sp.]MDZ4322460.1 hypothetical protein [Phenylobacterium sp.]MDZ4371869.1 hypothetical protein [Phenylobacterium sp.]QIH72398.1 hypothetical protein GYM46_05185 [Brevundimonas mediterranea]
MNTAPRSTDEKLRELSRALDVLERESAVVESPEAPKPPPRAKRGSGNMFADKLKLFFAALYAAFALLALYTGGLPSSWSEFCAGFVVPGLAATFLYFFYKGAWSRAKRFKKPFTP